MEHSLSWEVNSSSASSEIPCIVWNSKGHYSVQNSPQLVFVLKQITGNPLYAHPSHFFKNHINNTSHLYRGLQSCLFPSVFPQKPWTHFSSLQSVYFLLISFSLIACIISGEGYRSRSSLCIPSHHPYWSLIIVCVTQQVNIMSLEQKQMCPIQLQTLLVSLGFPNGIFKSRVKKLWS